MRRSSPDDPSLVAAVARVHRADLFDDEAEAKAAFHLRMRARGVQDLAVLRAFELVPRQSFVPHRYLDLAARDLALPIGCGQTIDEPWLVARMIAGLSVTRGDRVLQIGAGTGYATAILAHLAAEVIAVERFQSLAIAAQVRLEAQGVTDAAVSWADGLAIIDRGEVFDRIIVHGLLEGTIAPLVERLAPHGVMVCARPGGQGQSVVRVEKGVDGALETSLCSCRLRPIVAGLAAAL